MVKRRLSTGNRNVQSQNNNASAKVWLLLVVSLALMTLRNTRIAVAVSTSTSNTVENAILDEPAVLLSVSSNNDTNVSATGKNEEITTVNNNEIPRIAFVTFSYLGGNQSRWKDIILPATELMIPSDDYYYVVLTHSQKSKFDTLSEQDPRTQKILPIYVDCPEGQFGESPCCKMEKGLLYFYDHYMTKEKNGNYDYDWILYQDDDMYIRTVAIQTFAHLLFYNKSSAEEPVVLVSDYHDEGHKLGKWGYSKQKGGYKCSSKPSHMYPWGQPAVYNKASFQLVMNGFRLGGLVKQCMEFDVTHDVGNALFHWMYSLPAVRIHIVSGKPRFRPYFIGHHHIGRHGPSSHIKNFHGKYRNPGRRYPYDHNSLPPFKWFNRTGYLSTETFKNFGNPWTWKNEWHVMPVSDCNT